jgi:hypothetical protein
VVTFKPLRSRQGWYGVLAGLALLAVDGVLLRVVLRRPIDGLSFILVLLILLSLPLLLYLALRLWGCFSLRYQVDRDGVTIVWGAMRQGVAMGRIERIVRGGTAQRRLAWWPWPGLHGAVGGESDLGPYFSLATRPPAQQLLLVTPDKVFGISPAEPERFLEALQERNLLGPAHTLPSEPRWPPLWGWHFWQDRLGLGLLLAALALVLALFGVLAFRFPSLPAEIPLHFDALGRPDRVGPRQGLFLLPLIGLLAWTINTIWGGVVYRHQKLAAYLLWGGAIAVQIIAGLALGSLIR